MERARGAKPRTVNAENKAEVNYETVPASEVMVGDFIVFDQQARPTEVLSITEEESNGVTTRRIGGAGQQWIVRTDHEVNRLRQVEEQESNDDA